MSGVQGDRKLDGGDGVNVEGEDEKREHDIEGSNEGSERSRTKASDRPDISGGGSATRDTFGSAVSPHLDSLLRPGAPSDGKSKKSRQALKRAKQREKKNRSMRDLKEKFQELLSEREHLQRGLNDDDESTTLSQSSNSDRSKEDTAEYIRHLEAMLAVSEGKTKPGSKHRRQSIAEVGADMSNRMVYSQKYLEALEKHVSITMREKTDITNLMKTKGVDVFVPNGEWKGLTGLEGLYPDGYLELNWKEDEIRNLRIKVRARAVNPKLFDNVE